jgi:hypothetical protein
LESNATFATPEANICALLSILESIDWSARHAWNACSLREFNVGYEGGEEPQSITHKLGPQTLARVAALGATLGITIYACAEKSGG